MRITPIFFFSYIITTTPHIIFQSAVFFFYYHPISASNAFTRTQLQQRTQRFIVDYLKHEEGTNRNFLLVTMYPRHYTIYNWGAVNFDYANKDDSVAQWFNRNLCENVYVAQYVLYKTGQPASDNELAKHYRLEEQAALQMDGTMYLRISKITEARPGR